LISSHITGELSLVLLIAEAHTSSGYSQVTKTGSGELVSISRKPIPLVCPTGLKGRPYE